MSSWPSVQGHLLSTKLESHRGKDSYSYQAQAEYRYTVNSRDYRNNRVAINTNPDNSGDFQQNMAQKLQKARISGKSIPVWYDPDNPQNSLLNRQFRWPLIGVEMLFVLAFGGVGFALMFFGWRGTRETVLPPEDRDKPWLADPDWQQGKIHSSAKSSVWAMGLFAVFWDLISVFLIYKFPDVWDEKGFWVASLLLLFPLAGIWLTHLAIKSWRQWKRFGVTPLTLDPYPGSIGGDVGGTIDINAPYNSRQPCEVTLNCINRYTSGTGKNRTTREKLIWQEEGYARVIPEARGCALQFRFEVPAGLPHSEKPSDSYHLWRLQIKSELQGVNLERDFNIPVFETETLSRHLDLLSVDERPQGVVEPGIESLLPMTRSGHKIRIFYRVLHNPMRSFGIALFGAIFFGIGVFLWQDAEKGSGMLYVMAAIFSLVGGALILGGLYSAFSSLLIELDEQRISSTRRLFGLKLRQIIAPRNRIGKIEASQTSSSQQGSKHTLEYRIVTRFKGKDLILAEQIKGNKARDIVINWYEEELGNQTKAELAL